MCKQGDTTIVNLPDGRSIDVDRCIAPLVAALNRSGFGTLASCCGHGRMVGSIALVDGRELLVARDYWHARALEDLEAGHGAP